MKQLKFLTDHCKEKYIALSKNEAIIMNLDMTKQKHKLWKDSVRKIYDDDTYEYKDESDQMVEVVRDFDKFNFSKNDMSCILTKK